MEFIIPEFNRKERPMGIYMIWFDDKWFYIGSSKNIRSRFSSWKTMLTKPEFLKNKNIKIILPCILSVRFEIIETYKSASWLRRNETKEINKHWDNANLLNRCPDANTPKGMKPYFGYIKPVKILKGIPEHMKPTKIAVFNNNWELIKICNSKSEVERDFNFNMSDIKRVLSGERGQPRNIKLMQVSDDGSFIKPLKYTNPNSRKIVQLDSNGNTVFVYNSISDAARSLGGIDMYKGNLTRVLTGKYGYKTLKGYIWKYA